jgi:cyclopropane-fatty-acyl-phospholipid synthase
MADPATIGSVRDTGRRGWPGERYALLLRPIVGTISRGSLSVDLPSGRRIVLEGRTPGHNAHVAIHKWRTFARLAFSADIGFANGIADGDCDSCDLKTLLLWAIDNSTVSGSDACGVAAARFAARVRHALRTNTRRNSRRNISAHYDLGNAFYAAWLDEKLNYSSGIYESDDTTLDEAQATKIDRIAELMELRGGERVLEIGCGWGALAARLISQHQCHVTALTLSSEQHKYARDRIGADKDLGDIRLQDYRDIEGTFDRIASIEMIEAVGEAYWPAYFSRIASSLAADGSAVLQAITIDDGRYDAYRRRPDFIQLSIFPGGMLPTKGIVEARAKDAGLRVTHSEHFGRSYARTLADWRSRFNRAWPEIAALGFDERFRRLWNYYLVYCEVGFEAGWLDVGLYKLKHSGQALTEPREELE